LQKFNKITSFSSNNQIIIKAKGGGDGETNLLFFADKRNIQINQASKIIFNDTINCNLEPGIYNTNFIPKTGYIDFINVNYLDKSYPILKDNSGNDIIPSLWYKFDDINNIGLDSINPLSCSLYTCNLTSNYNIYNSECAKGFYSYNSHGSGTTEETTTITTPYLAGNIDINLNKINWSISLWVFSERGVTWYYETFFNMGSVRSTYQNFYAGYHVNRQLLIDNYQSRIYSSSAYPEDLFVWTHIVYTFNTTTRAIRIYRNGIEIGYGIFNDQFNTDNYLELGVWWTREYKLKGKLDDFRVYRNIILTPNQVLELFKGRVEIFLNTSNIVNDIIKPVAWYKFDIGNLTLDSSGNNNTLTNINSVASSTTEQSCALFNGTNYFQIDTPGIFTPNTFTISLWIKLIYNNTYKAILSCRNNSPQRGWILYVNGNNLEIWTGTLTWWDGYGPVIYYNFVDSSHTTTDTAIWKHLVVIFKTTTTNRADIKVYVNGLFIKLVNQTYYNNTTTNLRIGAGANEGGAQFIVPNGTLIGDFKFYDIELNENQINQLYNNCTDVYSNCDLIIDSSNSYKLSSNTLVRFNYTNEKIINSGDYYIKFFRGSIGFNYPTIRTYPILKDKLPILWYKFENSNNFLIDSSSNNNLWNSNCIYRDLNTIILPDLWYKFDDSANIGLNSGTLSTTYNLNNIGPVVLDTNLFIRGSSSVLFDSSLGDYLQLPTGNTNISIFQNLNFSICFWHYPTDNSQGLNNIFSYGAGGSLHIFK